MADEANAEPSGTLTPDEWPTDPEQRYARRQSQLAAHYGLDVDSRTVETDTAGRIHYLVTGNPDGRPVVLLHGVSTTGATWLPMAPSLTDEYRVYAPDRPGRGLSAAPSYRGRDLRQFLTEYIVELLDALDIDRPHVVGNSLGGQQAFLLAIEHDRVDRLCLLGAPAGLSTEFSLMIRLLTVRGVNRLLYWLMSRGDPVANAKASTERFLVADSSAIPDSFYAVLAAGQQLPGRQRSLRSMTTEQGSFGRMHPLYDIRAEILDIERPTGFVWGTADSFWPPAVGRPVADQMPDAEFVELRNYGHMPWLEPGEQAKTHTRTFLDGASMQ